MQILFVYYLAPSGLPRTVSAVAVTTRSIQVTWEAPLADERNGIIQHYLVMVMVQQTRASFSINSTSTSVTIPNLHPAYDYAIEVAAVTVRVGPYSSALSITTPDDGESVSGSMLLACSSLAITL